MPYKYGYEINDEKSGVKISRTQEADGSATRGSYSYLMPDGRTLTVKGVDDGSGWKVVTEFSR